MMTSEVVDNTSASRFELKAQQGVAFIDYSRSGDVLSLDHTEVPGSLAGQGIGSALARSALDLLRQRDQKIVVRCAFISRYIDKHPEYRSILATSD